MGLSTINKMRKFLRDKGETHVKIIAENVGVTYNSVVLAARYYPEEFEKRRGFLTMRPEAKAKYPEDYPFHLFDREKQRKKPILRQRKNLTQEDIIKNIEATKAKMKEQETAESLDLEQEQEQENELAGWENNNNPEEKERTE